MISGGQTGVDRGALDAALKIGVPCGGWCPSDRMAEDGKIPSRYPVTPLRTGGYAERTSRNVTDSDGTLIIVNGPIAGGTAETVECCTEMQKPYLINDMDAVPLEMAIVRSVDFISHLVAPFAMAKCQGHAGSRLPSASKASAEAFVVVNVAGPRASQWPEGHRVSREIVGGVLRRFSGHRGTGAYSD